MTPVVPAADPRGLLARWRRYFAERFPPLQHGLLIAVFCFGVQAYTGQLAAPGQGLAGISLAVAFVTSFLLILQLRILDEFKDAAEDARWRPYRPVPRGLVTLSDLRNLWLISAGLEAAGALWLAPGLMGGLLAIWIYSGLMGVEFFVRDWLKAHALAYMGSHIVIVPLIAAYVAACRTLPLGMPLPLLGLAWLLAASYFAFCVIEVGRKIRAPADEEEGVETYSRLWGMGGSTAAWLAFMACSGASGLLATVQIEATTVAAAGLGLVFLVAVLTARKFLRDPGPGAGRRLNTLSGFWTLVLFLVLGLGALYRV